MAIGRYSKMFCTCSGIGCLGEVFLYSCTILHSCLQLSGCETNINVITSKTSKCVCYIGFKLIDDLIHCGKMLSNREGTKSKSASKTHPSTWAISFTRYLHSKFRRRITHIKPFNVINLRLVSMPHFGAWFWKIVILSRYIYLYIYVICLFVNVYMYSFAYLLGCLFIKFFRLNIRICI